jgi:hypothetical protein
LFISEGASGREAGAAVFARAEGELIGGRVNKAVKAG